MKKRKINKSYFKIIKIVKTQKRKNICKSIFEIVKINKSYF